MRAQKKYGFEPDYAVPPGDTLAEVMSSLGRSQKIGRASCRERVCLDV